MFKKLSCRLSKQSNTPATTAGATAAKVDREEETTALPPIRESVGEEAWAEHADRDRAAITIQAAQRAKIGRQEAAAKRKEQAAAMSREAETKSRAEPVKEIPFEEAAKLAQEGDASFAVLAALSKKRDEMLAQLEDSTLDELISGTSGKKQKKTNVVATKAKTSREIRSLFLQFCRDRRGSGLRAWRLDIDLRGTNRVPYDEFSQNVMRMGLSLEEAVSIWRAFRPPGKNVAALAFQEFDPAEWANLNGFLEILWNDFNFDLDLVWSYFDTDGNGAVDVNEFAAGMEKIGFKGHAVRIFYGLDSAGAGNMWKETLHYLFMVQPESHVKAEDSPLIREFTAWVRKNFESAAVLCEKIGLLTARSSMSIHSTSRKLQQLGYKGNCLHTAITLSRCNQFVNRTDIIEAMGGCEVGPSRKESFTYAGRCMMIGAHQKDAIALTMSEEKPAWNGGTYDPCSFNRGLGRRERHCFGIPFPRPVREEVLGRLKQQQQQQQQQQQPEDATDAGTPTRKPRLKELRQESMNMKSTKSSRIQ